MAVDELICGEQNNVRKPLWLVVMSEVTKNGYEGKYSVTKVC